MEEKNNDKEMTTEDLAKMMSDSFEESRKIMDDRFQKSEKLKDKKLEKLATTIQKELLELKDEIKETKSNTEDIKADLNKKVDVFTHNDLKYRVEKLEKNSPEKSQEFRPRAGFLIPEIYVPANYLPLLNVIANIFEIFGGKGYYKAS